MPWASPDTTVADSETFARRARARWLLGEALTVSVWRGDRLVGSGGFMLRGRPLEDGTAEIGMRVRAEEAPR
jgi:hypothetical protein